MCGDVRALWAKWNASFGVANSTSGVLKAIVVLLTQHKALLTIMTATFMIHHLIYS